MNGIKSLLLLGLAFCLIGCGAGGVDDEPDEAVTVNIIEASATVEAGQAFQFHWTVSNATNTSCTWSVNDVAGGNAALGTITSGGLFTAPAAVPSPAAVTVKAVSVADATRSDTATVTIAAPPPFTVSPPTATVAAGATRQFATTPVADVAWSLEGADGNAAPLGSISESGLFTAPFSPPLTSEVTVVATSRSDSSVRSTAVASITFSDASFHGPYAFTWRATDAGQMMFAGGNLVADGHGGITSGTINMNDQARGSQAWVDVPFTGDYQVFPDGRALFTIQTAQESFAFRAALVSDAAARMMSFETGRNGAGEIERQDPTSFAAGLSGSFVFVYEGMGHLLGTTPPSGEPVAAAGRLTATPGGALTDYASDVNINGVWMSGGSGGTCSYTLPETGRGNLYFEGTAGAQHFYFLMLSADEALLVSYDYGTMFPAIGATGRLSRQGSGPFGKSSLSGVMAVLGRACGAIAVPTPDPYVPPWPAYSGAILAANGAGTFTGDTADNNMNGTVSQGNAVAGVYDVAANGRGTLDMSAGGSIQSAFYLLANNKAFTVGIDSWGVGVSRVLPQAGRPFGAASLNGRYALALTGTLASAGTDVTGAILMNGIGDLAGGIDINAAGVLTPGASASGTYSLSSNGRGTMTIHASTRTWTMTMYAVDPATVLLMGTSAPFSGILKRQF